MVFRIDLKIFIFLLIYYFTRQIKVYTFVMGFALIHELGHLLAGIILKMKVKRISIMPVGFGIEFSLNEKDYNEKILKSNKLEIKKLVIAIAGPATNALIILVMFLIRQNFAYKELIIYSNLAILLFNLLPIYPLDGGRILKSIFYLIFERKNAIIYINYISNITLFFVSVIFSILI